MNIQVENKILGVGWGQWSRQSLTDQDFFFMDEVRAGNHSSLWCQNIFNNESNFEKGIILVMFYDTFYKVLIWSD